MNLIGSSEKLIKEMQNLVFCFFVFSKYYSISILDSTYIKRSLAVAMFYLCMHEKTVLRNVFHLHTFGVYGTLPALKARSARRICDFRSLLEHTAFCGLCGTELELGDNLGTENS